MMRIPLFRIWYSTTYTALLVLTLILLCVSPGDTIYQSIRSHEIQKLFVIGGVYLLTFLIMLLIYSTRVYANRTVLTAIPKGYLPIEEGEVGKGVRLMVVRHLARGAVVAWDSRPRDVRGEIAQAEEEEGDIESFERQGTDASRRETVTEKQSKKVTNKTIETTILPIDPNAPPWGHISHPGWASPSSLDLPNLQYWSVICELPNLIEAKAVSLAPPDPALEGDIQSYPANGPPLPDAQIVTLLQRPRAMGLRDYLARLASFGLLHPPSLGSAFLTQYETARFSCNSLTEPEFRSLMAIFADVLNGMTELDPNVIEEARAQSIASDNRSLAPTESSSDTRSSFQSHDLYRTPQLNRQRSVMSYSDDDRSSLSGSLSSGGGGGGGDGATRSPHSPNTLRTALSSQQRRPSSNIYATPRIGTPCTPTTPPLHSASAQSLALSPDSDTGSIMIHSVHRTPSTLPSRSSLESLGSSARSVIRLHPRPSLGALPYQYLHQMEGG